MHLFEELVREKCGSNGVKLLKVLEGKENVSEFKISEDIEININELRIILYKFTEDNLVYSTRKKDKDKGWYVYYWTFNFRHARDLIIRNKQKQIEELNYKLNNKEIPKYVCPNGCTSMSLEDAMDVEFKCPECNSLLKLREVKYNEEVIRKKIAEIEGDLEKLRQAVVVVEAEAKEKKAVKKASKKKTIKKKSAKSAAAKKSSGKKKPKSKKSSSLKKSKKKVNSLKSKKIARKPKKKKPQNKKSVAKKQGIIGKLKKRIRF